MGKVGLYIPPDFSTFAKGTSPSSIGSHQGLPLSGLFTLYYTENGFTNRYTYGCPQLNFIEPESQEKVQYWLDNEAGRAVKRAMIADDNMFDYGCLTE